MTHVALVRFLQELKGQTWLARRLGYKSHRAFRPFIDRLLETARNVERLVRAHAGYYQPNPEYPWQDRLTGAIHVPAEHHFRDFGFDSVKMIQLRRLLLALLSLEQ
jgi:hypothetical protein